MTIAINEGPVLLAAGLSSFILCYAVGAEAWSTGKGHLSKAFLTIPSSKPVPHQQTVPQLLLSIQPAMIVPLLTSSSPSSPSRSAVSTVIVIGRLPQPSYIYFGTTPHKPAPTPLRLSAIWPVSLPRSRCFCAVHTHTASLHQQCPATNKVCCVSMPATGPSHTALMCLLRPLSLACCP